MTKKWDILLASFRGITSVPDHTIPALEETLDLEQSLLEMLANDPRKTILKKKINPNEHPIDSDYISMISAYADVLCSFKEYEDNHNKQPLQDIIKRTQDFKGKFRNAVKFYLKNSEIIAPRIGLRAYETKDGDEPLHRIAIRHYKDGISQEQEAEFEKQFGKVLNLDRLFRSRYHPAILHIHDFLRTIDKAGEDSLRSSFFKTSYKS